MRIAFALYFSHPYICQRFLCELLSHRFHGNPLYPTNNSSVHLDRELGVINKRRQSVRRKIDGRIITGKTGHPAAPTNSYSITFLRYQSRARCLPVSEKRASNNHRCGNGLNVYTDCDCVESCYKSKRSR